MKTFPSHLQVSIATTAYETIVKESKQYQEHETGGILVGKRLNEQEFLIVAATGAGPKADHQAHTFAPDIEFVNMELRRIREVYTGVDYVGVWHKHPAFVDHPSGGDLKQARKILEDTENYKIQGELLAPIAVIANGQVNVKLYYLNDKMSDFAALPYTVIPDDEPRLVALQAQSKPQAWYDSESMQHELAALRAFDKSMQVSIGGETLFVTVTLSKLPRTKVHLVFAAPYPSVAPEVVIEAEEKALLFPSNVSTSALTSGITLARWVGEIEQALLVSGISVPVPDAPDSGLIPVAPPCLLRRWKWMPVVGALILLLIYRKFKSVKEK